MTDCQTDSQTAADGWTDTDERMKMELTLFIKLLNMSNLCNLH